MPPNNDCQSLDYFQQKCYNCNIHNQLIKSIKNIDFRSASLRNDLDLLIGALNLILDQNPGYQIRLEDIREFGKTSVNDLGDIFTKVLDGTYGGGNGGASQLDQQNLIILCLLYLSNLGNSTFDQNLRNLLSLLAVNEDRNSQFIIWSLLAILEKLARDGIGQELLPPWLPFTSNSASNFTLSKKILTTLIKISKQTPYLFFKKSNFDKFWDMAKDESEVMVFEDVENLDESLFATFLALADVPIISRDKDLAQNIVSVACEMFNNTNIDYIDKEFLCQLLHKFLDIVDATKSEKSFLDLLKSTEKVLAALAFYRYDSRTVIEKLTTIAERNQKIINDFLRVNHKEIFLILSKTPNLLDFDIKIVHLEEWLSEMDEQSKLEFNRECIQMLESRQAGNGAQVFASIEQICQSLGSAGYDISQEAQVIARCARNCRYHFNTYARENYSYELILMVMPYDRILDFDVKLKYASVAITKMPEPLLIKFLSECLRKLVIETDKNYLKTIMTTAKLLFKKVFAPGSQPSMTLEEFLKNNQQMINATLRKLPLSKWLCDIISPHPEILDIDVQIKHLDTFLEYADITFCKESLKTCLHLLGSKEAQQGYPGLSQSANRLMIDFKCRDSQMFEDFLKLHQDSLNSMLRSHKFPWLCGMLSEYPQVLSLDNKIRYYNEISSSTNIITQWDLLSDCLDHLVNPNKVNFKGIKVAEFTLRLFSTLTDYDDYQNMAVVRNFADAHKTQFNIILRKNDGTPYRQIFEKLACMSQILDFDVKMKYLDRGIEIMDNDSKMELLSECLSMYGGSGYGFAAQFKKEIPTAIITLSAHIENNDNQFHDLTVKHRKNINKMLRENISSEAGILCYMCLKYPSCLEFDVKRLYFELAYITLSAAEATDLTEESVNILFGQPDQLQTSKTLSLLNNLLRQFGASDSIKSRLVQFAARHKSSINSFFENTGHDHLIEVLIFEEDLIDFNNILEYVDVLSVEKNKKFFWNFVRECLQYHDVAMEQEKITKIGNAIFKMFSKMDINGTEFRHLFENHKSSINSVLGGSDQINLFNLLLPYISEIDRDIKVNYAKRRNNMLSVDAKFIILDDIFHQLNDSPNKETVANLLPAVEQLLSSFDASKFAQFRTELICFSRSNATILNEVLYENKELFTNSAILKALDLAPDLLTLDVKMMFVEELVNVWDESNLLNLLAECLSCINAQNGLIFSPQLGNTINRLSAELTITAIDRDSEQHMNFAVKHIDTIKYLLNNHHLDFDPSLFSLVAPFPELLDLECKIRYLTLLLKTKDKKAHWALLEEYMETYIQNPTLIEPIYEILQSLTSSMLWMPENCHLKFAEKYADTFNIILAEEPSPNKNSIASFLACSPQFLTFDNKVKYLPVIFERMGSSDNFLQECLAKLKNEIDTIDVLAVSSAVKLSISKIQTWYPTSRDRLHDLADQYANELKKVIELVGCGQGKTWNLVLTRLGIVSMDFEAKVKTLRKELRAGTGRREDVHLEVNRSNVLSNSYFHLSSRSLQSWKGRFKITFHNENGVDAGGLMREWFTILTREIFNPDYALFTTASDDNNSYTINKASHVNPEHLDYFKFVGRFIGKAIFEKQFVACPFTKSLYKHILNIPVDFSDFETEDPIYCNSLKSLLNHPMSDLGLDFTFTTEIEEYGVLAEKELKEDGKSIEVTDENKNEYVRLLCQMKMTGSIKQQLDAFLSGFYDMIPKHLITVFTAKELELLICGEPEIDIDDLEASATYQRYRKTETNIQWFWRAVRSFDKHDKARLLMFVTGSSKAPPGGFKANPGKKFVISKNAIGERNRLPTAHTCAHQIVLPQYDSYEKLHYFLQTAIRECSEGFAFS